MYRALPEVGNKRLNEMWKNRDRQIHLHKLSRIKACIDNSPPREFSHLKNNSKRRWVQEENFRKIERENKLLLKKMIMISNEHFFQVEDEPPRGKSLNYEARRRELDRISMENQRILHRIEDRRPYYDRRDWDRHWDDTLQHLRNISEYPYQERRVKRHRKRRGGVRKTRSADGRLRSRTPSPTATKKKMRPKRGHTTDRFPAHLDTVKPKHRNKKFKLVVSKGGYKVSGKYCMITIVLDKKDRRFSMFVYEPSTREDFVVHVPIKTVDMLVRSLIVDRGQPANSNNLSALLVSRLFFSKEGKQIAFSSALTEKKIPEIETEIFQHRKNKSDEKSETKSEAESGKQTHADIALSEEQSVAKTEIHTPKLDKKTEKIAPEIVKKKDANEVSKKIIQNMGEEEISAVTTIQSFYRGHKERLELRERLNALGL